MNRQLTDRYIEAKRIAMVAAELAGDDRDALIERESAGDAELAREVRWMLAAIDSTHTATLPIIAEPSPDLSGHDAQAATPRHYRIVRRLGEGGMGTVYLAERSDGDVVQQVALKLLAASAEGSPLLAERFCQERKLLARLEHPGIARLLDGGALADGKPFLAMEYVDGERIDSWCDRHNLDLAGRIALFLKVCAAVDFAHRHLIIHRDIKPANILVTGDGQPKLLDFGIARVLDDHAEVLATATAAHAMTLAYASPEQVERLPLTTAADVYSLGVVLYQLVAGVRPYQNLTTPHLLSHAIVSGDLVPPSRAAAHAGGTAGRPPGPRRPVPRDIDAIVLKALRRKVEQRYVGVPAFMADLQRFLDRRPVLARRGRRLYRLRRFVQRNRLPLAAAALVLLAVLAGLGSSLLALRQTRIARALAEQRQLQLQRMVDFQQSMLDSVDIDAMGHAMADAQRARVEAALAKVPGDAGGAREALDAAFSQAASTDIARHALDDFVVGHALDSLGQSFADAPALGADLRQSLARVLISIGSYGHAVDELHKVLAQRLHAMPFDRTALLGTRICLARALYLQGRLDDALAAYTQASREAHDRPVDDPSRMAAESGRLRVMAAQGHLQQALPQQQALYTLLSSRLPATDPAVMSLHRDLVVSLLGMGRRDQALAQVRPQLALDKATLGEDAPETLDAMITLAKLLHYRNDYEQSLALAREASAVRQRRLGGDHPDTLAAREMVAMDEVYLAQDPAAFAKAGEALQRVLDARRRVLGADHPDTVASETVMVRLLSKEGEYSTNPVERHRYLAQAIALEHTILASHIRLLGADHPNTLLAHGSLANLLSYDGQYAGAIQEARLTLAGQRRVLGPDHPIVFATWNLIGDIEAAAGDWAAARQPYEQALAGRERLLGVGDAHTVESASRLYAVLVHLHDAPAALAVRRRYMDPLIALDPAKLNASMRSERDEALSKLGNAAPPARP